MGVRSKVASLAGWLACANVGGAGTNASHLRLHSLVLCFRNAKNGCRMPEVMTPSLSGYIICPIHKSRKAISVPQIKTA